MNWKLSRISIPVFDLEKSKNFYNLLLNDKTSNNENLDTDEECFVFGGDIELRLYKLKNELGKDNILQSRRTFPTIALNELDLITKDLDKNNINYSFNKSRHSIMLQEPGLNYIELVEKDQTTQLPQKDFNYIWNFHHINLECYDVRLSVNFLNKNFNMTEGEWLAPPELGDVNINPNQLAIFNLDNNHSGIHINKADFLFSWRNKFIHNPTIGGHPAFNIKDINQFLIKLEKLEIPFTDAKVYAMPDIHQVYLFDPNANIIEINQNIRKT